MAGATDLLSLERGYQPFDIRQNTPAPKKKGNLFTKLLPAIGGAAGIALAPFTGGGSLALLGLGALGGAAGKIAENKVEGQGAFDNPGQIALEGLFGAAGGGLAAFKGARATKAGIEAGGAANAERIALTQAAERGGASAGTKAADVALQLPTAKTLIPKPSISTKVNNVGEALKGEARGIKPGVTVPGTSKKLTGQQSDKINAYLDSLGAKKSAHTQYRVVQADVEASGKHIGDLVATHDRPVMPNDIKIVTQSAADKAKNALGFKADDQLILDAKTQLGEAKSLSELRTVRSNLDEALQNFYKQTERDSTTTANMKVIKGYRDGIDRVLSGNIPGFKEANTRYATGLKASEQLLNKANPTGLRFFGVQTGVGGESVQGVKDLAGRAIGKAAKILPNTTPGETNLPGNVMKFIKPVATQEAIHAGGNVALGRGAFGPQPVDPNADLTPEQAQAQEAKVQENLLTSLTPEQRASISAQGGDTTGGAPDAGSVSGMSYDQLIQLVQQDPKNAQTYIALYKAQPSSSSKPMSAEAAKTTSNAQAGLEGLSQIRSVMANDPGAVKRTLVPGRGLVGGFLGNVFQTNDFDAARQQVVDVIARLRTGAAISKTEESRFLKFLPQPFDSPSVAQQKLGYLERQFQRVAASNPAAANDIQAAIGSQDSSAGL